MKKIEIIIIDSGVKSNHPSFAGDSIKGFQFSLDSNIINDFDDSFGHGTAIYGIVRKVRDYANITNIKIPNIENGVDEELLIGVLEYISDKLNPDIINLSLGINITYNHSVLYEICKKLSDKGVIIVAAFDNTGAFSYPAAFDCVIGVTTGREANNTKEFIYIQDEIVNIAAFGGIQRLAWTTPDYIMFGGNSFACSHVTVQIAQYIRDGINNIYDILNKFKDNAVKTFFSKKHILTRDLFVIEKAILFPFNKEMHSLVRYSHLLNFEIVDIYDIKYSAKVGATTCHILNDNNVSKFAIKNITSIDWDSFDTLILGHLDELSFYINQNTLKIELINEAIKRNKKIYAFDDISTVIDNSKSINNMFYPKVDENDLPLNRYGMLYRISKPVLAVFGTSSKQGKFTLQLKLRELFLNNKIKIGQIGSEPSSLLFGMDYVFPMGYGNTVTISEFNIILYLNYIINKLCMDNNDIILVGSQSGTVSYDTGNLQHFMINQTNFLMGVQPDGVILCINPFDEFDYIKRTINFIESCAETYVLALVVYPMNLKSDWTGIYGGLKPLTFDECYLLKQELNSKFDLPIFILGDEADMNELFETVLSYFSDN